MGIDFKGIGKKRTPDQVVVTALRALKKEKVTIVDGRMNFLVAQIARFLPRKTVLNISFKLLEPKKQTS